AAARCDDARMRGQPFPPAGHEATNRALAKAGGARAVVLVEGFSDQIAIETLAVRRGRDLAAEGVVVVPIGGGRRGSPGSPGSSARAGRICGWQGCATSARRRSTGAASSGPASARASLGRAWSGW